MIDVIVSAAGRRWLLVLHRCPCSGRLRWAIGDERIPWLGGWAGRA